MKCTRIIAAVVACLFFVVAMPGCATVTTAGKGVVKAGKVVGKTTVMVTKKTGKVIKNAVD
ncbi:MAG: hypothetical protein VCD00_07650 [Candidatus Hydrogenedentota bacterium]